MRARARGRAFGAARQSPLALVSGALLSLLLETAQSFLPARIASNVDVLANVAGAAAGAVAAAVFAPVAARRRAAAAPARASPAPGAAADLGLTLLGLWLFAQLNPATLLFGTGDLRDLLAGAAGERHTAELFVSIEAAITAANLAAVALLASAACAAGGAGAPAGGGAASSSRWW